MSEIFLSVQPYHVSLAATQTPRRWSEMDCATFGDWVMSYQIVPSLKPSGGIEFVALSSCLIHQRHTCSWMASSPDLHFAATGRVENGRAKLFFDRRDTGELDSHLADHYARRSHSQNHAIPTQLVFSCQCNPATESTD